MELLKNLEGLSADEQMTAVVELQKAAMKTLEEQKQASIGKSAELVIQGLKKIKSDFEERFNSLNYDIQTKVASLKDGEQGLQGPKGDQGERGLDGANGRDGRDGKDGKDGLDGVDGVGVRDAKIDFDGSLVISLTDGREINCGEVVSVDVAKQIQKVTHNIQTGSGGDSQTVLDAIAAIQATIATYGTMATQNANNVAITGGAINNTTIGATTPSTGVFTTLTATGQTNLGGDSSLPALQVNATSGITRYCVLSGSAAGGVTLQAQSSGGNPGFTFISRGAGVHSFASNGTASTVQFQVAHTASAVNYVQVTGAATTAPPTISSQGSDTNISLSIASKGTGAIAFRSAGGANVQMRVYGTNSAVNNLAITGTAAGSAPILSTEGSDTNIDLTLTTKGTGSHVLNTGGGTQFKVLDLTSATTSINARGGVNGGNAQFGLVGTGNTDFIQYTLGTGAFRFLTNGIGSDQMRISHTASAVNYVQVTGAATGGRPVISAQGSDSAVGLTFTAKGAGIHAFNNGNGTQLVLQDYGTTTVNRIEITPSATTVAPKIVAGGTDTNISLVLSPKGTGALQAQQADGTATGGNARGANAVDWQTSRNTAAKVANGQYAVISGGNNNTASGINSFIGGGTDNSATTTYSTVCSGLANTSSGLVAVIAGGQSNVASSYLSFIGSGISNLVGGRDLSAVVGGQANTARGFFNFVGGGFTNSGTSQNAVTTQSGTMNGTTAVTLSGSNASIKVGQVVTGTSIASYTYVAAISGTSLTLSQAASGSSTSTLSFYTPHGVVVGGGNNQATGSYSFIGGGGDAGTAANRNVASGDWSTVAGGIRNQATAYGAIVCGGADPFFGGGNVASGQASSILGAANNTASAYQSSVLGGTANTASGTASRASGLYAWTRGIAGAFANGYNGFGSFSAGTCQYVNYLLQAGTTDATPKVATADGAAASTVNQVILPNNSAYYFRGEVVSGVTGGGNTKGWFIEGVIKRGANAASTALVGTPTVTSNYADAGASTWTIAVTADTTNGGLAVTFTGQAATTIRTVAQIRTTEMTY